MVTEERAVDHWRHVTMVRPLEFPYCDWPQDKCRGNKFRLGDSTYFKTVTHRGGWKSVMQYLIKRGTVVPDGGVTLIDVTERWFLWERKAKMSQPWVGILHLVAGLPQHIPAVARLESLFARAPFIKSLPYCRGLIVLAEDTSEKVRAMLSVVGFPRIKICSLLHPIAIGAGAKLFNPAVDHPDTGGVLLLGSQYRRVSSIHALKHKNKMWLPGSTDNVRIEQLTQSELAAEHVKRDGSVVLKYVHRHADYDELVKKNVVVIDVWGATANNAVMEAIALRSPFFVRRLQATVQYLGEDYPMLFDELQEVQQLLDDPARLRTMILKAHQHLSAKATDRFSLESFATAIEQCSCHNGAMFRQGRRKSMSGIQP